MLPTLSYTGSSQRVHFLLHQAAAHAEYGGDGRDLTRVIGLDIADRDQGVAALGDGVGGKPFQLAHLVAAKGQVREPSSRLAQTSTPSSFDNRGRGWMGDGQKTEVDAGETGLEVEGHQ
jgi:hypothetical protein